MMSVCGILGRGLLGNERRKLWPCMEFFVKDRTGYVTECVGAKQVERT